MTVATAPIESIYGQTGRIPHEEIKRRAVAVLGLGRPSAAQLVNRYHGKAIIAGGGPSLQDTLPDIRRQLRGSKSTKLVAVNRTHDWMLKKGLKPDFGILIDPKPWVAHYMTPTKGVKYCLGAKVDMGVWERFRNHREVYHWHPLELAEERDLISHTADWIVIPGQSTVGLRSVPLMYCFGFRKIELHGLDCNKRDGAGHAYKKFTDAEKIKYNPESDLGHKTFYVKSERYGTRYYYGTTHMARQCGEFANMLHEFSVLEQRGQEPCDIRVAGDSAVGYVAALKGVHVNESYNDNPSLMPMTGCVPESEAKMDFSDITSFLAASDLSLKGALAPDTGEITGTTAMLMRKSA